MFSVFLIAVVTTYRLMMRYGLRKAKKQRHLSLPWGTSQDRTVQLLPVVKVSSTEFQELGLTECNV